MKRILCCSNCFALRTKQLEQQFFFLYSKNQSIIRIAGSEKMPNSYCRAMKRLETEKKECHLFNHEYLFIP